MNGVQRIATLHHRWARPSLHIQQVKSRLHTSEEERNALIPPVLKGKSRSILFDSMKHRMTEEPLREWFVEPKETLKGYVEKACVNVSGEEVAR